MTTTILRGAQSYNGKLSNAAIGTYLDILRSIEREANTPMYNKIDPLMLEAFFKAKAEAKNKREFVRLAKQKTGLLKSDNQFIMAFIERHY